MNPRFLRDEAARFRAMAADTDREATQLRLLAMAADYEARAIAAGDLAPPPALDAIATEAAAPPEAEIAAATTALPEAEITKPKAGRKLTLGLKGASLGERRPVGRPRLRMTAPNETSHD